MRCVRYQRVRLQHAILQQRAQVPGREGALRGSQSQQVSMKPKEQSNHDTLIINEVDGIEFAATRQATACILNSAAACSM